MKLNKKRYARLVVRHAALRRMHKPVKRIAECHVWHYTHMGMTIPYVVTTYPDGRQEKVYPWEWRYRARKRLAIKAGRVEA